MPYRNRAHWFVMSTYCNLKMCTKVSIRTKASQIGDSCRDVRIRLRSNQEIYLHIFTILSERMLSYLDEQWDRDRSRQLKLIYCDLTVSKLTSGRIDSHHIVSKFTIIEKFHDQLRFVNRSVRYRSHDSGNLALSQHNHCMHGCLLFVQKNK